MFLSDNGKTFKAAASFVKAVFKDATVQEHLAGQGVKWKFNIERAPWWGGAFERLVKSTKRCLRKMVGCAKLSLDELQTLLVEVESILNSRPLSYVSADDLEEPLTPSHLLMGRRVLNLPDNLSTTVDIDDCEFNGTLTSTQLKSRMRRLSESLNYFWTRWRDEYLTELRETHRLSCRSCASRPCISVGDIVIVHDKGTPRGYWKLGRVEELFIGRDSEVRGASVRLSSGHGILRRPLQLLYPVVLSSEQSIDQRKDVTAIGDTHVSDYEEGQSTPTDNVERESNITVRRPRRKAAIQAGDHIQAITFAEFDD